MTVEGAKIIDYDMNLSLDPVSDSCILCVALLIEGRLRRQSRWRSQAWRPAAAACNRRLGRQGTPPAGHYDPAARSFALRMRRKCRKLKRGPGPKSPRWSAERRASPRHGGAGAFAKAPRRAASITARRGCASCTRAPVGAPPPLDRGGKRRSRPGRKRVAGMKAAVPIATAERRRKFGSRSDPGARAV